MSRATSSWSGVRRAFFDCRRRRTRQHGNNPPFTRNVTVRSALQNSAQPAWRPRHARADRVADMPLLLHAVERRRADGGAARPPSMCPIPSAQLHTPTGTSTTSTRGGHQPKDADRTIAVQTRQLSVATNPIWCGSIKASTISQQQTIGWRTTTRSAINRQFKNGFSFGLTTPGRVRQQFVARASAQHRRDDHASRDNGAQQPFMIPKPQAHLMRPISSGICRPPAGRRLHHAPRSPTTEPVGI